MIANKTSKKSASQMIDQRRGRIRDLGDPQAASRIRFSAIVLSPRLPAVTGRATANPRKVSWTFLTLPKEASARLPSRGQTTVEGTLNGLAFRATLEPDGQGGHWLKVNRKMREAAGAGAGDVVTLEIAPVAEEPEPKVPGDLRKALAAALPGAREVWSNITPLARRDWIHWIVSAKQAETRARRIRNACSMLAAGKRRPCCFDRSGMYDKSLSCPAADDKSSHSQHLAGGSG
jgi:hypothetical protein